MKKACILLAHAGSSPKSLRGLKIAYNVLENKALKHVTDGPGFKQSPVWVQHQHRCQ